MVRTTIIKIKDEERIMIDLIDVLEEISNLQEAAEQPQDFMIAFFSTKRILKEILTETIDRIEQKNLIKSEDSENKEVSS